MIFLQQRNFRSRKECIRKVNQNCILQTGQRVPSWRQHSKQRPFQVQLNQHVIQFTNPGPMKIWSTAWLKPLRNKNKRHPLNPKTNNPPPMTTPKTTKRHDNKEAKPSLLPKKNLRKWLKRISTNSKKPSGRLLTRAKSIPSTGLTPGSSPNFSPPRTPTKSLDKTTRPMMRISCPPAT